MATKRILQVIVIVSVLVSSFAITDNTLAWYGCSNTVTVQWGDTLSGIAATCGTTVEAIRAANPGLGWWVYAGQVLYIPTGYNPAPAYHPTYYGSTYTVQWGDTLAIIAANTGTTVVDILAVNPQIWNANYIYSGQVINLPAKAYVAATVYVSDPPYYPSDQSYVQPSGHSYDSPYLKITYKRGLFVRCDPGGEIIGWATYDEFKKWYYVPSSIYRDAKGKVWVQVTLDPPQSGYTIGWILVKDQFGAYFTSPQID
jgi:LysM repeat protein